MPVTTNSAGPILTPAQIEDLFLLPVLARSVAGRVCDVIRSTSPTVTVPRITSTPSAEWVEELQEIPVSDASFDAVTITPKKVAGLVIVSSEARDDTAGDLFRIIGDRLVDHSAYKTDQALFTTQAAPAPAGIAALAGVTTATATGDYALPDVAVDVAARAADQGAPITAWVANPATRTGLGTIKTGDGGPYLFTPGPDGEYALQGAPLIVSSLIPEGTVWAIPKTRLLMVIKPSTEADIDISEHSYFTRDGVAVRSKMRVGFGCIDPSAITKITLG